MQIDTKNILLRIARCTPMFLTSEVRAHFARQGINATEQEVRDELLLHGYEDMGTDHWRRPPADLQVELEAAIQQADRAETCLRACAQRLDTLVAEGKANAQDWAQELAAMQAVLQASPRQGTRRGLG